MLSDDTRPIRSIQLERTWHKVGEDGVTKITVFDERGEMSLVPWFEVWRGSKLLCRSNAAHVREVYYEEGV
jgi:hypothetical protein